jgi:hypothetical protein
MPGMMEEAGHSLARDLIAGVGRPRIHDGDLRL